MSESTLAAAEGRSLEWKAGLRRDAGCIARGHYEPSSNDSTQTSTSEAQDGFETPLLVVVPFLTVLKGASGPRKGL